MDISVYFTVILPDANCTVWNIQLHVFLFNLLRHRYHILPDTFARNKRKITRRDTEGIREIDSI